MAASDSRFTFDKGTVFDSSTGKTYKIDYSKVTRFMGMKRGTQEEVDKVLLFYLNNNRQPTDEEAKALGINWGSRKGDRNNVFAAVEQAIKNHPELRDVAETKGGLMGDPADPRGTAFNEYYKDLYSLDPGTSGRMMLDTLEQGFTNQAVSAGILADTNYQAQALQQAQTVKAITDQVRAERMARLKAGMSEAQIANQDMQMMMANVNALNQNAQMLNQARLEAQLGLGAAKDQAYQAYLEQANARGQVASAMRAADAGDLNYVTDNYLQRAFNTTKVTPTMRKDYTGFISGQPQTEPNKKGTT